jgi:hypothetical protein
MTHREFLIWLKPQLEKAAAAGLGREGVRAVHDELTRMRKAGALQPFASKLLNLVRAQATLDPKTVASLVADIRTELAPPREQTVVLSAVAEPEVKRRR